MYNVKKEKIGREIAWILNKCECRICNDNNKR